LPQAGPIATGIFGKGLGLGHDSADLAIDAAQAALAEVLARWQPLPHVGNAEDIARPAVFLASDASRLINGHNLIVDGGITIGWPVSVIGRDLATFAKAFRARLSSQGR
jgi:NAD(P)-dependent dehydrogenase (short-subunit alcohol dehydrogenase family)